MDSSTSTSETVENVYLRSYFILVSFGVCVYVQYFSNANEREELKQKIFTKVNQKKIKCSRKECVT